MLVFGDPQFEIETRVVVSNLLKQLEKLRSECDRYQDSILMSARDLLIGCGQLEQGIADARPDASGVMKMTDLAADLFLASVRGDRMPAPILSALRQEISPLISGQLQKITIKIPEGFAFYCLYPEQYITAAETWLRTTSIGSALVIGIRTIGTSLSALVQAVLRAAQFPSGRITVRPRGHPFQRSALLPDFSGEFDHALIVDEGPGLSGSSMASVAKALAFKGMKSISFFPAHRNGPGPSASIQVKEIWNSISSVVSPFEPEIQLGPVSLKEKLESESQKILRTDNLEFSDLSAGNWRNTVFRSENDWPPVVPIFERTKYLLAAEDGHGALWKFAGLGAGPDFEPTAFRSLEKQARLSESGFAAEPLQIIDGFLGCRWYPGQPLTRNELDRAMIQTLAAYLVEAAGPKLTMESLEQSISRLSEMILLNLNEALGEGFAVGARAFVQSAPPDIHLPTYGDGRMAPHEWIRTEKGNVLKTDCWGHAFDHTCVGCQSVLWDVAGAILEWRMNHEQLSVFMKQLSDGGLFFVRETLTFYLLGYASFRLGMLSMAQGSRAREESSYFRSAVQDILANPRKESVQFLNCTS